MEEEEQLRSLEEQNEHLKISLEEMQADKKEKKELEEQNEQLKRQLEVVEVEKKEMDEVLEELRGMVQCPVCLSVPRQGGPVPVCRNGHFLCHTCKDGIRQEALATGVGGQPKCPSCMVELGNATSLLASRLIEKLKHECEQEGCEEMIPFPELVKHKLVCLFRNVLCPGGGCKLEIQFNKLKEHANSCAYVEKQIEEENLSRTHRMTRRYMEFDDTLFWHTDSLLAHGNLFFMKEKRENKIYWFETIMLGTEEECKDYLSSTTVLDEDFQTFATYTCHPRPISLEKWGDMGLTLSENALARIWMHLQESGHLQTWDMNIKLYYL